MDAIDQPPQLPQTRRDNEHLRLLVLFHYIVGVLLGLFSSLFIIHVVMGLTMFFDPDALRGADGKGSSFPPVFGLMFAVAGGVFVLCGWTIAAMTIFSGRSIQRRRRWLLSVIVAGINCAWMPFGTALGVFTIVVLMRPSIRAQYGEPPF